MKCSQTAKTPNTPKRTPRQILGLRNAFLQILGGQDTPSTACSRDQGHWRRICPGNQVSHRQRLREELRAELRLGSCLQKGKQNVAWHFNYDGEAWQWQEAAMGEGVLAADEADEHRSLGRGASF